jgi:hypothetical protein
MDAAWRDRPEDLCYDGETVEETIDSGEHRVVVTSHRVLAFAPGRDPRFRQVDRPNVTGVRATASGEGGHLRRAGRAAAWGVGLLVAGVFLSLDGMLASLDSLGVSAGGALSFLGSLFAALALLDDALRAVGGLLLLAAVALVAFYFRGCEQMVVVEVSGSDDVEVPGDEKTAVAVRDALRAE